MTQEDSKDITLDPSEGSSETFTWDVPKEADAGTYDVTVQSEDDSETVQIEVKKFVIIDDYEDGDLSEYQGDIGAYATTTSNVGEGSVSLAADGNSGLIYSVQGTNNLKNFPQEGDRVRFLIRDAGVRPIFLYAVSNDGTERYGAGIREGSDKLIISSFKDGDGDIIGDVTVSEGIDANKWYMGEVLIPESGVNDHHAKLWEVNLAGFSLGTKLADIQLTDSTVTPTRNIGFRTLDTSTGAIFDRVGMWG